MFGRCLIFGFFVVIAIACGDRGAALIADENDPPARESGRRVARKRNTSWFNRQPQRSTKASDRVKPEWAKDSIEDVWTQDDDEPAGWSDDSSNRLIASQPPLIAPPEPERSEDSELSDPERDDAEYEFDPWHGDFQKVDPGDEQPYWISAEDDEPLGWVGDEYLRPADLSGSDFYPVPDRYRIGFPKWDRYVKGSPLDPYNGNVLKGDYPLCVGDDKFLELTVFSESFIQARRKLVNPTGVDNDTQVRQRFFVTTDYFEDDNTFTPSPWFFRVTQAVDIRDQDGQGHTDDYGVQEAFFDYRVAFLSEFGDVMNWRIGRQGFQSDFRGFLYSDVNNMSRLFWNWDENKWQYNLVAIDAVQQDAVSQFLRTSADRDQVILGGNAFRRDVPWLGFNLMGGAFWVQDNFKRRVDAGYFEFAAEGVIGPYGVSGAFIQAIGRDSANPFAQRAIDVNAQFAALEVTRPTNWFTPRLSFMYASGDKNPRDGTGRGFDAIFDNPTFAGANFAFFNREQLNARGLRLTNFNSFLPNLRTKAFDPMNFVNPGIMVFTAGVDTTVTTTTNAFINFNYYLFDQPAAIEHAIAVKNGGLAIDVDRQIGHDITIGIQYRPYIINNVTFNIGSTGFFQGDGLRAISASDNVLFSHFANAVFVY